MRKNMKKISLTFVFLTSFVINLLGVKAVPFLITFAQPDGSTFQAHLRGDENFSWIETKNKAVIVKSKTSGFFEFALLKINKKNHLQLVPSGIPVIKRGQSTIRSNNDIPKISRSQLDKIWQRNTETKRKNLLMPAKKSSKE